MRRYFLLGISSLLLVASLTSVFFIGYYVGFEKKQTEVVLADVINKDNPLAGKVDFAPFWQAWQVLDEKFVAGANGTSTDGVTDQDRVWGAISGMADSLEDPYTTFLPPVEKKQFEETIAGNFGGVGMEVGIKDDQITVIAPLPNSPAKKAGILAGDRVVKVDDLAVVGLALDEVIDKIRGEKGTIVRLTIQRNSEKDTRQFSVIRDTINIPTIKTEKLKSGVFVISLYNFSAESPNLFRKALREFLESKTDKLIIDLRGNPGGYLEASIDMASWFLPADKVVVYEAKKGTEETAYRSKGYDIFTDQLKLVILIDRGSASASEILAGALKEHNKARLVGEKTFGKGSVQELIPITSDTSLKVTVARWLTPDGHSLSGDGLEPDFKVLFTKEDIAAKRDPQMEKAVEILTKG